MKIPTASDPMIDWALYYASMGMDVFPLKPGTKDGFHRYDAFPGRPSQKYPKGNPYSWQAQASHDIDRVRKFWTDHPDANIGCATGIRSGGLYVCDFDREHVLTDSKTGKPYLVGDGLDRLKQWEKETGQKLNDETAISITGNGGYHYFYRADGKRLYNNGSGASDIFGEGTGNDIRGNGNFTILPPSIHPNGNRYEWEQSPDEYPPIEADEVFYQYWNVPAKRSESGNKAPSYEELQGVTSGRHDALKSYMAKIIGQTKGSLDHGVYVSILRSANEALEVPIGSGKGDRKDEFETTVLPLVDNLLRRESEKNEEQANPEYWKRARMAWCMNHPGEKFDSQWEEAKTALEQIAADKTRSAELDRRLQKRDEPQKLPFDVYDIPTLGDIMQKEMKPIQWRVKDLIDSGLTILASPPKFGKSWFSLDLCLCVGNGEPFLLHDTTRCGCIYFALEDSERRIQDRTRKLTKGRPVPESIRIMTRLPDDVMKKGFSDGVIPYLNWCIETYRPGVVIIDTFQKIRQVGTARDPYGRDYKEMGELKSLADNHDTAIIVVHHLKKGILDTSTPFDRISGTSGITGAADTMIVLSKDKWQDVTTTMSVTGRDVPQNDYVLQFDKESFKWMMRGTEEQYQLEQRLANYQSDPIVKTIKRKVAASPEHRWKTSLKELKETVDAVERVAITSSSQEVRKMLGEYRQMLKNDGIVYENAPNGANKPNHFLVFTDIGIHQFYEIESEKVDEDLLQIFGDI